MADITMCMSYECPLRAKCYRYRANSNAARQSYGLFVYNETKQDCEDFMPIYYDSGSALLPVENRDSEILHLFSEE